MKWMLAGAACAMFALASAGSASATQCSSTCNRDYSLCNAQNGGNAQQMCMPKWMQCKKVCTGSPRALTPISTVPTPKR